MASIPRSRGGSGGKILRTRRSRRPATPYDRPGLVTDPDPDSPPRNPNWLSKLILSPTRLIASGAGKVISSVFGPESSSSSSSGAASDSGTPPLSCEWGRDYCIIACFYDMRGLDFFFFFWVKDGDVREGLFVSANAKT